MTSYIQQLPTSVCAPLYNNVKPILKFISIQEVFISIFNSDSVVKNNQNQKAGKVSQPFLKTVNLGALSIWEPSTRTPSFLISNFFISNKASKNSKLSNLKASKFEIKHHNT